MKAHISLSAKQRASINKDIQLLAQQAIVAEREDIVRRSLKLMLCVLHNEFGFGNCRANRLMSCVNELSAEANTDEIFWEQIDKVVIERMGLKGFERDYTR